MGGARSSVLGEGPDTPSGGSLSRVLALPTRPGGGDQRREGERGNGAGRERPPPMREAKNLIQSNRAAVSTTVAHSLSGPRDAGFLSSPAFSSSLARAASSPAKVGFAGSWRITKAPMPTVNLSSGSAGGGLFPHRIDRLRVGRGIPITLNVLPARPDESSTFAGSFQSLTDDFPVDVPGVVPPPGVRSRFEARANEILHMRGWIASDRTRRRRVSLTWTLTHLDALRPDYRDRCT